MVKTLVDDSTLITRIREGDASSLKYLYQEYFNMILHLVNSNSGNHMDAEDLYQESLVTIYEKIVSGALDELTCSLRTYVYSVCRNKWLYHLRKKGRYGERFFDSQDFIKLDFSEDIDENDSQPYEMAMQESLKNLEETCRKVLLAFYYEKLSLEIIAEKFGYNSANTAKSKKNKCMNKIRASAREAIKAYEV